MLTSYKATYFSLLFLICPPAMACLQNDFLPPNNMSIPMSEKGSGISEERFHAVIDKVEEFYSPLIYLRGAELKIHRKWASSTVNAGTFRDDNYWHINLYGGFARHPLISEDGFALVVCHELGHHIGGAPKKYNSNADWSSNEGQADYFATLKCLRNIFENEDNELATKNMNIPDIVKQRCSEAFNNNKKRALCIRSSMAGHSVAKLNSLSQRVPFFPSFETPDLNEVSQTIERHPKAQCRLDTYFMGSVCEVSHYRSLSQSDEVKGTCHEELGYEDGLRPLCWFKPQ